MPRPVTGQLVEWPCNDGSTSFGVRFRSQGKRHYVTLGNTGEGMTPRSAEVARQNLIADVRRGLWKPPETVTRLQPKPPAPMFHTLAVAYVQRRQHEVDARTVEHFLWALDTHLVPFFGHTDVSRIDVAQVEAYKAAKLADRDQREVRIGEWRNADPETRGRVPERGLGNGSINKTLKVLAQVLDDAVEQGHLDVNPARGKRRRLKAAKPRRTWLELHEVQAVIAAADKHRALIATMILAGLRVSELCALRWRDVDLAAGKLRVTDSKTDAGIRVVDVSPMLLDELKLHRADSPFITPDDLVFATSNGTTRNRSNITRQVLQPAIDRANRVLVEAGRSPIEDVTNHSLRRTFCALLYEAGASPGYVMQQMGHTDASLALEIYNRVMERKRDTGERMDALVKGADWAGMDRSEPEATVAVPVVATEKPLFPAAS